MKATTIARQISVIIPGCRSGELAPRARAGTRGRRTGRRRSRATRRDEVRARERRRHVAEPLLEVVAPDDDGDRQHEAQPELVAEHRDGVAGVAVVGRFLSAGLVGVRRVVLVVGRGCHTPPQYPTCVKLDIPPRRQGILMTLSGTGARTEPARPRRAHHGIHGGAA